MFRSNMRPSDLAKQTTLIISNEEMNDIMKKKREFLSMLLEKLGASLLGNLLTVKELMTTGEETIRAGQFLIPPDPLTNLEIQNYCQYESKFNGVYSRNN